jgi:hypothetical protein
MVAVLPERMFYLTRKTQSGVPRAVVHLLRHGGARDVCAATGLVGERLNSAATCKQVKRRLQDVR